MVLFKKSQKTPQTDLQLAKERNASLESNMNKHISSRVVDFLEEGGVLAEAEAMAVKRVIAFQLDGLMKEQKPNKTQLAKDV